MSVSVSNSSVSQLVKHTDKAVMLVEVTILGIKITSTVVVAAAATTATASTADK